VPVGVPDSEFFRRNEEKINCLDRWNGDVELTDIATEEEEEEEEEGFGNIVLRESQMQVSRAINKPINRLLIIY